VKNPQVNSPVRAGPRWLKSRTGEGVCLSFKKPTNLRVFIENLPIKVIYTHTVSATTSARVSPVTDGGDSPKEHVTCEYHPRGPPGPVLRPTLITLLDLHM